MVRLKDIAQLAGVSAMTVSRVLRGSAGIAPRTRSRVLAIARQHGYVPDSLAQGLRTRTNRLLAMVVPTLADPQWAAFAAWIEDRVREAGYDLLLAQSRGNVDVEERCVRRILARRPAGIFLAPIPRLAPEVPLFKELERSAPCIVVLGQRPRFCSRFPHVASDDETAALQMTRHLLRMGHAEIAFLAGPVASPASSARFQGYRRALGEVGVPVDDRLVFRAGEDMDSGEQAARQMLSERTVVTAILADNDLVALGALQALQAHGLEVPRHCSLASLCEATPSAFLIVPLATVVHPQAELANAALETMLCAIAGKPAVSRIMAASVVLRASVAAKPS